MTGPENPPFVQLTGEDGNAYAIIARCRKALKEYDDDHNTEYAAEYVEAATKAGSYDELLQITMDYVNAH